MPRHMLTVLDVAPPRATVRLVPKSYDPEETGMLDLEETESTALQVVIEGWVLARHVDDHPRAKTLDEWHQWLWPDDGDDQWGRLCDIAPDVIEHVELHEEVVDGGLTARLIFTVADADLLTHLTPALEWESAILYLEDSVDDDDDDD